MLPAFSQKVDTLYYDKDWKVVEIKQFASFIRYALYPKDINARKLVRDFYVTGEIQGEGGFLSIDPKDDSKSIWEGECVNYYKNNKKERVTFFRNGVMQGSQLMYFDNGNMKAEKKFENGKCNGLQLEYFENGNKKGEMNYLNDIPNGICTDYKENGNVNRSCNIINGKINGIYTQFYDDDISCQQVEMKDGEPTTPYYTYSNKNGASFKLKFSDNSIYLESPDISQKKTFLKDGTNWEYYSINGLFLAVSPLIQRDYGKYLTLNIVLSNNSPIPILISPESIIAFKTNKGTKNRLETLSSDDYSKKINGTQMWSSFFNALGEGMAASNAGYSSSASTTNTAYANNSISTGVAAVVGTGGAAIGGYESNTTNFGVVSSNTNTASYNGTAAYQANMIANQRINDYNFSLNQERQVKEEGYLKANTINPGETISGYINIKYEKTDNFEIYIDINAIKYPFIWSNTK